MLHRLFRRFLARDERQPKPGKITGFPAGEFSPDQVIDDEGDFFRAVMVAACMNHGGMVMGHVDDQGNLTITPVNEGEGEAKT